MDYRYLRGFGNECVQNPLTGQWDCGTPYGPPPKDLTTTAGQPADAKSVLTSMVDRPGAGTVVIDAQNGQSTVVPAIDAPDGIPFSIQSAARGIPKWAWLIGGALVLNGLIKRG